MKTLFSIILRFIVFVKISFVAMFIGIAVAMGFDSGVSALPIIVAIMYLLTFVPSYIVLFLPSNMIFKPPIILKAYYYYVISVVVVICIIISSNDIRYAFSHSEIYKNIKYNKVCFTNNVTINSNDLLSLYNKDKLLIKLRPSEKVCLYLEKKDSLLELRAVKCREIESTFEPSTYETINIADVMKQPPFVYNVKHAKNIHFIVSEPRQHDGTYEWRESK